MHKGQGYEERKSPHSKNTNDLGEVRECQEKMGDGKKCKEEDYAMKHDRPIHGGGGNGNSKGKMSY